MKMKIVVYGILIVSAVISDYSSADGDAGEKDADLYHSKYACTNRFEYRDHIQRSFTSCSDVIRKNPLCGRNITVSYSNHPPYINVGHDGDIEGILPGMLNFALKLCCFGCYNLKYIGPFEDIRKFQQNATFIMPIQTTKQNHQYFGHDYIHMFEVKAVSFIGPTLVYDSKKMIFVIFDTVLNSLPLFGISIAMAITAGVTIWVLDSAWNQNQFPDNFPRGPFEGFWWAVVSMTTVGYGDRSPKSVVARLFAILWILTGITIFSLYTASLTSSISTALVSSHDKLISEKRYGVLNTTTLGEVASLRENTKYKPYKSIDEIKIGIQNGEIGGLAVDENIAKYFGHHLGEEMSRPLVIYKRMVMVGSSYGLTTPHKEFAAMMTTFFMSNDDQRDSMAKLAAETHEHEEESGMAKSQVEAYDIFIDKTLIQSTGIALLVITVILVLIGLLIIQVRSGKKCLSWPNKIGFEAKTRSTTRRCQLEDELITMIVENHNQLKEKLLIRLKNENPFTVLQIQPAENAT